MNARLIVIVVRHAVRAVETAGEQQIGQLGEQLFEIELVEIVAGELRVAILQWLYRLSHTRFSFVLHLRLPGRHGG